MNDLFLILRRSTLFVTTGLALLSAGSLRAANVNWNQSGSANWNVAGNWSGSTIPTDADAVRLQNIVFNGPNQVVIPLSYGASYNGLTIDSNSNHFTTLDIFGSLIGYSANLSSRSEVRLKGGTWWNLGALTVGSGGGSYLRVTDGGELATVSLDIGNLGTGIVSVTSGEIYVQNDIIVSSGGLAQLTIDGGLVSSTNGIVATRGSFSGGGEDGTVSVSSGTWRISNDLVIAGIYSTGTVNISGGLVEVGGITYAGLDPTYSSATINLSGTNFTRGMLSTSRVYSAGEGYLAKRNYFTFDGGILQARANQSDFLARFRNGDVTIKSGGAFIDSNGYDIGINTPLSGTGGLTKLGAGALTLTATNSYAGPTTIRSGTVTVTGVISHTNSHLFVGELPGNNGTLNITGGTVRNFLGYAGMNFNSTGRVAVTNGGNWINTGALYIGSGGNGSLLINNGSVSATEANIGYGGSGTATVTNGSLTSNFLLVGAYAARGHLQINGGLVSVSGSSSIGYDDGEGLVSVTSGTWNNSGNVLLGDRYIFGSASGTGRIDISGGAVNVGGTMTLGSYTTRGAIALSGSNGNRGVLSTARIVESTGSGSVAFDGGILRARGNESDFISGFEAGEVTIGNGGAFIDTGAFTIGISSPLSGSGALTKQGAGTLTLGGNNSYAGGTVIESGTVRLGHAQGLGAPASLAMNAGTTLDLNGRSLTVTSLTGSSGAVITMGAGSENDLRVNQSTNTTFAGRLQDGSGGALYLNKFGTGTLTLTGSSSYTGETYIVDGAIFVMGDISASSLITIDDRSTLGGTGKVGDVRVLDLGIIAPGASPGLLTIDGNLTMDVRSIIAMEFTGTGAGAFDQLQVNGLFNASGVVLDLSVSYTAAYGDSFQIFTNTLPSIGAFTIETNLGGGLSWNTDELYSDGILTVVPEPGTMVLSALGLGLLGYRLRRRR